MKLNEFKDMVRSTSYDSVSDVELIDYICDNNKELGEYDLAVIECESEFTDEDYQDSEFIAYFDTRDTKKIIKKGTKIGVEYTDNEETSLILFKNVTTNS
jgi:hypothetical protein